MKEMYFMIPHPDDEIIGCSYLLKYAIENNIPYKIFLFTDGENDFIGEMVSFCNNHFTLYHDDIYVSICKKLMFHNRKINTVYMCYVLDVNKKPVIKTDVKIATNDSCKSAKTNELGWVCFIFEGSTHIENVMVNNLEVEKESIKPLTQEYHKKYGELRYLESVMALKKIGGREEAIERLQFFDGSLWKYNSEGDNLLKTVLKNILNSFKNATFIIPHEKDYDEDHKALSEITQNLMDENIQTFKYLIHNSYNHRKWPNNAYVSSRLDRMLSNRLVIPENLNQEEYIEFELADVNLDKIKKLELIYMFKTQNLVDEYGFLLSFAKENEIYFTNSNVQTKGQDIE